MTPPSTIVLEHLSCLKALLQNLPAYLPLDPLISNYTFALNLDLLEDAGYFGALGCCLKNAFQTWNLCQIIAANHSTNLEPIISFTEHGQRLTHGLIDLIKSSLPGMSPTKHTVFMEAWIDCLIRSCEVVGATVKSRLKQPANTADFTSPFKCTQITNDIDASTSRSSDSVDLDFEIFDAPSPSSGLISRMPTSSFKTNSKSTITVKQVTLEKLGWKCSTPDK